MKNFNILFYTPTTVQTEEQKPTAAVANPTAAVANPTVAVANPTAAVVNPTAAVAKNILKRDTDDDSSSSCVSYETS